MVQVLGSLEPAQDVRHLRVGDQAFDTDLLPFECAAIGEGTSAWYGATIETFLEGCHVIYRHNPAHPPATHIRAGSNGLPKRCLFSCWVFEDFNNFEILSVFHREKDVTCPKARVDTTIDPVDTELLSNFVSGSNESFGTYSIRNMIQAHSQ